MSLKLDKIEEELKEARAKHDVLQKKWDEEKAIITKIQNAKSQIEDLKVKAAAAERAGDYGKVAELRYGKMAELQKTVEEYTARKNAIKDPILNEAVTPGKIAVLDESGWVYYRTPLELLADLGTQTLDQILALAHPVGSIYMSINNVSPATLFGGKWVQIKGRFLLGASDVYKANTTGGEEKHTLTTDEMPTHTHYMAAGNAGGDSTWTPDDGSWLVDGVTSDKNTWWAQIGMNNAGGSAAHNNMPPYLVVYMWRRLS